MTALEDALTLAIREIFRLQPEIVSEHYSGEDFGNCMIDRLTYRSKEIIKYNQVLDLAVIRIDRALDPLPIYHGPQLSRGQKVVAIGSPLGYFNSVSDGIISGIRVLDDVQMIQYTAPGAPGSSGGALLNMYGEVIGIVSASSRGSQGINWAEGTETSMD